MLLRPKASRTHLARIRPNRHAQPLCGGFERAHWLSGCRRTASIHPARKCTARPADRPFPVDAAELYRLACGNRQRGRADSPNRSTVSPQPGVINMNETNGHGRRPIGSRDRLAPPELHLDGSNDREIRESIEASPITSGMPGQRRPLMSDGTSRRSPPAQSLRHLLRASTASTSLVSKQSTMPPDPPSCPHRIASLVSNHWPGVPLLKRTAPAAYNKDPRLFLPFSRTVGTDFYDHPIHHGFRQGWR